MPELKNSFYCFACGYEHKQFVPAERLYVVHRTDENFKDDTQVFPLCQAHYDFTLKEMEAWQQTSAKS